MRGDLLRAIAANTLTIPIQEWDMSYWMTEGEVQEEGEPPCGTAGCAIGHAIKKIPAVAALLTLTLDESDGLHVLSHKLRKPGKLGKEFIFGLEAVACALEISYADAEYLFLGNSYKEWPDGKPSREAVANRIRQFVEAREAYENA